MALLPSRPLSISSSPPLCHPMAITLTTQRALCYHELPTLYPLKYSSAFGHVNHFTNLHACSSLNILDPSDVVEDYTSYIYKGISLHKLSLYTVHTLKALPSVIVIMYLVTLCLGEIVLSRKSQHSNCVMLLLLTHSFQCRKPNRSRQTSKVKEVIL